MNYKYRIFPLKNEAWPKNPDHGFVNVANLLDIVGDLELCFSYGSISSKIELNGVMIAIFINEAINFFERVNSKECHELSIGFAPFAFGKKKNGYIYLSHFNNDRFSDGIFDQMSPQEIDAIISELNRDAKKFGRLKVNKF